MNAPPKDGNRRKVCLWEETLWDPAVTTLTPDAFRLWVRMHLYWNARKVPKDGLLYLAPREVAFLAQRRKITDVLPLYAQLEKAQLISISPEPNQVLNTYKTLAMSQPGARWSQKPLADSWLPSSFELALCNYAELKEPARPPNTRNTNKTTFGGNGEIGKYTVQEHQRAKWVVRGGKPEPEEGKRLEPLISHYQREAAKR